jgi:hypothetical protein
MLMVTVGRARYDELLCGGFQLPAVLVEGEHRGPLHNPKHLILSIQVFKIIHM